MEGLKTFIQEKLFETLFRKVDFNEKLMSTRTLDSIGIVDLIVSIEEYLEIEIPTEEINEINFETINRMVDFLGSITVVPELTM